MELEEAIKQLKDLIKDRESFLVGFDDEYDNVFKKDIQAIETVLNQLEQYKRLAEMNLKDAEEFQNNMCEHRCILYNEKEELKADLYEANNIISDYIDTTAKQEKMIDLMGEFLANLCNGLEVVRDNIDIHIIGDYSATKINKYDKKSIKQYFEKKAEEV